MNPQRIAGIALLVAGVILVIVGMNASPPVAGRWSSFIYGYYADATVRYIVGGVASLVVGAVLMIFSGRTRTT